MPLVVLSRCGAEMPALRGRIAGDEIALHPGDVELVDLRDLRHDAADDARLELADQRTVGDLDVAAALVRGVADQHRPPVLLAHEARFLPALRPIKRDQLATETGLEDVRQQDDRGLELDPGEAFGRRQLRQPIEDRGDVAPILAERLDVEDAERGIENEPRAPHPEPAGRRGVGGNAP